MLCFKHPSLSHTISSIFRGDFPANLKKDFSWGEERSLAIGIEDIRIMQRVNQLSFPC